MSDKEINLVIVTGMSGAGKTVAIQSFEDLGEDDTVTISLLDVQNKKKISVAIDREENKYSAIEGEQAKEV